MATVIIVVLVSVFVFLVFFSVYLKRCIGEVEQADGSGSSTRTGPAAVALPTAVAVSGSDDHHHHHHHRLPLELQRGGVGQGLNKALVEALPILSFSVVKDLRKRGRSEGGSKESLDCAVCLNEFGKDENLLLRLLPACNHAFHVDCIDVWFQSHSTCPLCRSSLLPIFKEQLTDDDDGGGGGAAAVTVEEAASRRILEAQGQNCASGAAARDGRRILLPESWSSSFTGTPRQSASVEQITAEEEEEEEEEEGEKVLHLPL
jgi:E3 ubiquitin-protein ligase ATL6/9/15/31/42/55